jgi:selenocysteine-specific elongation factor
LSQVTARHFVVATAGHVDHGKSALVKALTGTDPDRLPEEKARGITIDLGFAHLQITGPDGKQMVVGIVDVPGHEDFVRNMIAGVGSIDLALLMVAADDGWMPQTEEHLQILLHLGMTRLIVAITKSDLSDAGTVEAQIRQKLSDTPFFDCPIVATSATDGTGIAELREAIVHDLSEGPPALDVAKPRLSVDRAFILRGLGTVVTGTLAHGSLRRGQSVVIQPGDLACRIRSIQTYGRDVEIAPPGARTALNLPDLALGQTATTIKRGDVITTLTGDATSLLDVLLRVSARSVTANGKTRPVRNGSVVDVHHGTSRVPAKVVLFECESLGRGAQSLARLRLEMPLLVFMGDRLVLRDRSQQYTLAGGIVLDPSAQGHSFRSNAQQAFLHARAVAWNDPDIGVASEIARDKIVHIPSLLQKSSFAEGAIAESLRRLQARGEIKIFGHTAADQATWHTLRERAIGLIDRAHLDHPELAGLDLSALRSAFRDLPADAIDLLLHDLNNDGFARKGQLIARQAHQVALPARLETMAARIREMLAAQPFDPPSRKMIAVDENSEQALQFLIKEGSVVEISPEVMILREELDRMKESIRRFLTRQKSASTSQIRQELKTSRRTVIPLLEYLDRQGMTRRVGDQRVLAN